MKTITRYARAALAVFFCACWSLPAGAEPKPFRAQQVTWFCRTADRVDELMMSPGPAFMHKMMLSVAKGDCGIGLHGTTFVFMPVEVAGNGTSSESEDYVILKGRLFPRLEGGIEVFAPFGADSFGKRDEKKDAKPTAGQPI